MDVPTETDVKLVELKWISAGAAEKYNVVLDACDLNETMKLSHPVISALNDGFKVDSTI